jgi:hypothetical protein
VAVDGDHHARMGSHGVEIPRERRQSMSDGDFARETLDCGARSLAATAFWVRAAARRTAARLPA